MFLRYFSVVFVFTIFHASSFSEDLEIPLENLQDDSQPLEMVLIEAGTFTMGSPVSERGRYEWDWPAHQVTITNDFYLGRYEITQAQWKAVHQDDSIPSNMEANHPVTNVSWYDCVRFCNRLSEMNGYTPLYDEETWEVDWDGEGFRLPTEAEWEYACRAGTQTRFYFGDALTCADEGDSYCSIADPYMWWAGNNTYQDNKNGPKEVGLKRPNDWDLYDMHGNVWEWCNDWDYWPNNVDDSPRVDPRGSSNGNLRVRRGSFYDGYIRHCRSANHSGQAPDSLRDHLGMRIVLITNEEQTSQNINTSDNFPDPNFRAAVEAFMKVDPGDEFTEADAKAKTGLFNCTRQNVKSVVGIEFFENITAFYCDDNQITNIDISNNTQLEFFTCSRNNLTSLDVSQNTELKDELDCRQNPITSLDISNNAKLTRLICVDCKLEELDLTHNPDMAQVFCDSNELTSLDISHNLKLQQLTCSNNYIISNTDFIDHPSLTRLDIRWNYLDEDDWEDVVTLREQLGEDLLYSPQNNFDPYDFSTAVEHWRMHLLDPNINIFLSDDGML